MLVTTRPGRTRSLRRGLGVVATPVGGSIVYSSNPIMRSTTGRFYPRPIIPTRTGIVATPPAPAWGGGPVVDNPASGAGTSTRRRRGRGNQQGGGWQGGQGGGGGWQGGGWQGGGQWSPTGSPYGSTPQNPNNSQALAAAQALLATNPSLLSPQQFAMLQQAGLVSSTLPYSSASQITPTTPLTSAVASGVNDPNCLAAGCTGGPYPNCTCAAASSVGTDLSSDVGGLPLYAWLLIGGVGLYLVTKRR